MQGARLGPYRILAELGSGGMGKVYLAEVEGKAPGLDGGTRVALKVIHPHLLETPGFFKRFLREAEIGRSVEQDNVVRCFDCDQLVVDGVHQNFLVMEYVEGQTLRGLLNELERVPEELCRHIARETAKGLVAIHEAGVVHRDLKPENVLITSEHVVKVMDLGVARLQDEVVRLSQSGAFVGSLEYACPEQFRKGGSEVDARSDLYALGVMLYELSTGEHPYRTDDTSTTLRNVIEGKSRRAGEVNPQLTPFFEEVVHTLAAGEPDSRFASASVLLEVLEEGEKSNWWRERARALRVQTRRPLRRIRIPRETPLHGRDDALAWMQRAYEAATRGDGQVLLIEGEAGIGKTRLVDEFVGRLLHDGEDINFLFGSYPPGGAATAAGAFSTAYREQFGTEALEATLEGYLVSTPVLVPAFAALLKGEPPPEGKETLTKDSLQTVFVHATRRLAAERPTLVLIDDLHFAPEEGRALFASLALAAPGHRILIVGTMRPGVPKDWIANVERCEHASRTTLDRLGPEDMACLLEDAFHSRELADDLGMLIAQKCDGNPFFAFEIIRGLREGRFISQRPDGSWATTRTIHDIQVPSSVLDLVNARIGDLSEEERDLLDVGACCGFQFDPLVVAAVTGEAELRTLKRLSLIERRHHLVRSSGRVFTFDHHQVQEAIYTGLPEPLRERYHAAVGEALETREGAADRDPKDLDGSLCVDLCQHFLEGGQGERALRYLDVALDHLSRGYLNDQAILLAERALEVPGLLVSQERMSVLLRTNGCLDLLGRRETQSVVLAEARSLAEPMNDRAALTEAERATTVLLWSTGCYEAAREHGERCLAIARESGDRLGEAMATGSLGAVFYSLGRYREARDHHERHLAIAREIGERKSEAMASGNLGNVSFSLGRYGEAQAHYERWLAIARELHDRRSEARASGNLGNVFYSLGRYGEAKACYERHMTIAHEIGDRRSEGVVMGSLGNILFSLGRHGEAKAHDVRSLATFREIGDRWGEAYALSGLAHVAQEADEGTQALDLARHALALRREISHGGGVTSSLAQLGALHWSTGNIDAAREALGEAADLLRQQNRKADLAYVLALLACIPGGEPAAAETALREAGEAGNTPRTRYHLWKATRNPEHLHEAKRLLDYRVEHAPEEYRESMLKNVRLNREIMAAWASLDPERAQRVEGEHGEGAGSESTAG